MGLMWFLPIWCDLTPVLACWTLLFRYITGLEYFICNVMFAVWPTARLIVVYLGEYVFPSLYINNLACWESKRLPRLHHRATPFKACWARQFGSFWKRIQKECSRPASQKNRQSVFCKGERINDPRRSKCFVMSPVCARQLRVTWTLASLSWESVLRLTGQKWWSGTSLLSTLCRSSFLRDMFLGVWFQAKRTYDPEKPGLS